MQQVFEFIIPEGKVVSSYKGQWTLQGVEKEMVKMLHPQLYDAIDKQVQDYYVQKELQTEYAEAKRLNDFRHTVTTAFEAAKLDGYELDFPMSRSTDPDMNVYIRPVGKPNAITLDISYDRYCNSDKRWIKHYKHKNTRYGSVEKALTSAVENIKDAYDETDRANKREKERSDDVALISKELGFKAVKDEYYHRSSSPYKNGTTEKVIAVKFSKGDFDGATVHLSRNEEGYTLSRIKVNWSLSKIPAAKMIKLLAALQDITKEV